MTNVSELLNKIQKDLKAPKSKYNSFGEYNYRSLEDILEGAKKMLPEGAFITLSDDLVLVGDRYYVKATATLGLKQDSISVSAFAREDIDRKKMHPEQLTGCSSSYARKYALNGLFCIDDTKDADASEVPEEKKNHKNTGEITREHKMFQRDFLYHLANTKDVDALIEEMGDQFDSLPEHVNGLLTDAISSKRQQLKNGVPSVPAKFGFIDVQEAVEFCQLANEKLKDEKNLDDLTEWFNDNSHKIEGLDFMLKAAKYQTPEGTPSQRLKKAYDRRFPQAAE